jgi:hypothetical protein
MGSGYARQRRACPSGNGWGGTSRTRGLWRTRGGYLERLGGVGYDRATWPFMP